MSKDLIIIGASGHGKVIADIARQLMKNGQKSYSAIYFLDDDRTKSSCGAYPVMGSAKDIEKFLGADFFVAIGDADIRKSMTKRLKDICANVPVLIHPKAIVGEDVQMGEGTVVVGGAIINPGVTIGRHCIINTGATVDHDCNIGDYVHVAPGAHICGGVHIGENTWIGAGATVVQELDICAHCMIGAGSLLVHDVDVAGVYMGNPAHKKKVCS